MIQRIQSVWLLLALLGTIFLIYTSDDVIFPEYPRLFQIVSYIALLVTGACLFLFRNRKLQIKLSYVGIFLNALLAGLAAYWLLKVSGGIHFPEKGIELFFPILSMASIAIARFFIMRDERLVKSADRLR